MTIEKVQLAIVWLMAVGGIVGSAGNVVAFVASRSTEERLVRMFLAIVCSVYAVKAIIALATRSPLF